MLLESPEQELLFVVAAHLWNICRRFLDELHLPQAKICRVVLDLVGCIGVIRSYIHPTNNNTFVARSDRPAFLPGSFLFGFALSVLLVVSLS